MVTSRCLSRVIQSAMEAGALCADPDGVIKYHPPTLSRFVMDCGMSGKPGCFSRKWAYHGFYLRLRTDDLVVVQNVSFRGMKPSEWIPLVTRKTRPANPKNPRRRCRLNYTDALFALEPEDMSMSPHTTYQPYSDHETILPRSEF